MVDLAIKYNKAVQEEDKVSAEKLQIQNVGKIDPKKHLEDGVTQVCSRLLECPFDIFSIAVDFLFMSFCVEVPLLNLVFPQVMGDNIVQSLGTMLDAVIF
jgi:hypothetical protein